MHETHNQSRDVLSAHLLSGPVRTSASHSEVVECEVEEKGINQPKVSGYKKQISKVSIKAKLNHKTIM
jgi:hypothetical protein